METKELKIQAPKGYEIDKENSTFERIIFKPTKKDITYGDVCNNIFNIRNKDTGDVYHLKGWLYGLIVLFNKKEDAQAVIDNPNFREILDTIYKD